MSKRPEAYWLILQAIADAQGDPPTPVTDVVIAGLTRLELAEVRAWLKTLESVDEVQVERRHDLLAATLTPSGAAALRTRTAEASPTEPTDESAPILITSLPPTPARSTEGPDSVASTKLYTVWYGTNRRPIDQANPSAGFSGQRESGGRIHHGSCDVSIPRTHQFGSIGSVWWKRWLAWSDDRLRIVRRVGMEPGRFWEGLRATLGGLGAGERQALIYIHGYNVSFDEATIRAAQIGFDLKVPGAMAFFSWPSRGSLDGYSADEASIEASEDEIREFVARFAAESGAERVHILAHSMGNRGLLRAVQRIGEDAARQSGVRFGQIFLAAPDVDADLFRDLAGHYPRISDRTTLYVSSKDRAVEASRWLHGFDRAGYHDPVTIVEGVDTVAVDAIDLTMLGHGYFAEAQGVLYDIYNLIRHDEAPGHRIRIVPKATPAGLGYWAIDR